MPIGNTQTHYGTVAKLLHWATVAMLVLIFPLGLAANGAPETSSAEIAEKVRLFSLHKTLGVALFFTAVARILWAITQLKPLPLNPNHRVERLLAEAVHTLLYLCLVLVPLAGWVSHAAADGFAPILWPLGQSLPLVPQSPALAATAAALHVILERTLLATIALHIAGALKHALFDRDATLSRMASGPDDAAAPAPGSAAPLAGHGRRRRPFGFCRPWRWIRHVRH